ncbi:MAG TPA: nucleotidyltransferase domain-containing protein [Candidatus Brocadiaceae bacterium]|nr:nucleotidyltransferase domain-containing protein [Candidatus Brocadiaceae bacterium]
MVYKKNEVRIVVLKYAKELQKRITVKKIILFGSNAYGNLTKSSDIDIAVISDRFKKMDDIARIMLLSDYARRVKTDIDIDPIGFTEDELEKSDYFEIGGEIVEKGVVLYNAHG